MPLTKATKKFINEASRLMEKTPIDLSNLKIEDYRKMCLGYQSCTAPIVDGIRIKEIQIPVGDDAEIKARIFDNNSEASEKLPCLIFIPGGGFIAFLDLHDSACSIMAAKANCRVIMLIPRLAPEYKAPIPLQDTCAAVKYIFQHGADQFNLDMNNMALGGDSAGANLALGAALQLKDAKGEGSLSAPIKSLQLISGTYDLSMTLENNFIAQEAEDLFSTDMFQYMISHYIEPSSNRKDPMNSPYFADLKGLPPTDLLVAEYDGVRHQTEKLQEKLQAADVITTKQVLEGQIHSYLTLRGEGAMNEGVDPAQVVANNLLRIFSASVDSY